MMEVLYFTLGILVLFSAFALLCHADQIRNSRYWSVGWLAYILLISLGGKLIMPAVNHLNLDDDVAVPCLFIGMALACIVTASYQFYRLRQVKRS